MGQHMVMICDSVNMGFNPGNTNQGSQFGVNEQLRLIYPGSVQFEGFAGATVAQDASTVALATTLAAKIGSQGEAPNDIVIQRGTNDWNTGITAANFFTYYTNLVNALGAAWPAANITCLDPSLCFLSGFDESTANGTSGNYLRDFRVQIKKVVANAAKPNVTHEYAAAWVPRAHLPDGLHPDPVGCALWARGLLGTKSLGVLPQPLSPQTTPLNLSAGAPWGYYEGDNLALGGYGTLATWPDLSGNARNYTQATGANQPGVVLDAQINLNVMENDGARYMATGAITLNNPCMRVLVVKAGLLFGAGTHDVACDGAAGAFNFLFASDTTPETYMGQNGQTLSTATAISTTSWNILVGIWNGTTWTLIAELGPTASTNPTRATATKTTGNPGGATIGALSNGTRSLEGYTYGDYIYAFANESAANELVEGYIKPKLGL
jgi:lysophospholipase L1-like esterase